MTFWQLSPLLTPVICFPNLFLTAPGQTTVATMKALPKFVFSSAYFVLSFLLWWYGAVSENVEDFLLLKELEEQREALQIKTEIGWYYFLAIFWDIYLFLFSFSHHVSVGKFSQPNCPSHLDQWAIDRLIHQHKICSGRVGVF